MTKRKTNILALLLLLCSTGAGAQNYFTPFSPFSSRGLGEFESAATARQRAMGDVGIANSLTNRYSHFNPATFSQVNLFILDAAVGLQHYNLKTSTSDYNNWNYKLHYISLAFKPSPTKDWGISIGLLPYTLISYQQNLARTDTSRGTEFIEATGGLSKAYIGTGIRIIKGLSIGGTASYIFGQERQKHSITFPDTTRFFGLNETSNRSYRGFGLDAGMLYNIALDTSNFRVISIGATYTFNQEFTTAVTTESTTFGNGLSVSDSITSFSGSQPDVRVPGMIGVGLQYKTRRSVISTDFRYQAMSEYDDPSRSNTVLSDYWSAGLGLEYTPDSLGAPALGRTRAGSFFRRASYRAGFRYTQTQFPEATDLKVTLGMGMVFRRTTVIRANSYGLDLALQLGQTGTLDLPLDLRRQYVGIVIGFRMLESGWFVPRKLE